MEEVDASRPDAARVDAGPIDAGLVPDICVELPFREPPREIAVSFVTQIVSADIFFLVDVTGSMGEEIDTIRTTLREQIIPALAMAIPDAQFGVGHFADFNVPGSTYGDETDEVFRLLQRSTGSVTAVQDAVDALPMQGGRDGPESMVEALYLTATGAGIGTFVPPAVCPSGTVGYPCFRSVGARIILTFSDAPTHNGPGGHDAYDSTIVRPTPHTYEEAVSALRGIGAKVLGLYSGGDMGVGLSDLNQLARDTGAIRPDGSPVVLDIGHDGRFLTESVIEAVRTLADEVPLDVDAVVEDFGGDEVDASLFVEAIVAASAEPPSGATISGDRFDRVTPGTRVTFRISLFNDRIPQTDEPQSFLLWVVLRGDRVVRLQETLVQIVVPAIGGGTVCSR